MNGPRVLKRTLSFYTLQTVRGSGRRAERDSGFDWRKFLNGLGGGKQDAGRIVEALHPISYAVLTDVALPCLALYRPLNKAGLVTREADGMSVKDLDTTRGFELMNATAFFFLPAMPGLVCMLQGDPASGSPPTRALRDFATAAVPQDEGVRWVIEPVRVESQIEELRRSAGVERLRLKARSDSRDLFGLQGLEKWAGFTGVANYFAQGIEGEVEVSVSVRLPKEWRTDAQRRRFKDLVLAETGVEGFDTSEASVLARTVHGGEVSDETLTLAAHDLATKIEFEIEEGEPVRFSEMVGQAATDLVANGDRYQRLALGGTDGGDEAETGL
ncbi:hypothetical protein DEU31_3011 [Brachybacterium sp. AG952]|uniref:hypothetical protein n=1 Tax=Brachybacterium sp. AG952 TaxID=2183989 RepID=UPI0010605D3E|nr:hypothetical protein [Brachybacterium sp. AG952]NIB22903.1 hypothetical protein [Pseudoteredinibacter isoporae]TDP76304.1 hypothetical protein DEU31_3011 [Brachybacterium sp. AG952]